MTTNMQQGTLLDVLKKKMRQTKEEMEKYKDECEEYHKKLQLEAVRREEVSKHRQFLFIFIPFAPTLLFALLIWSSINACKGNDVLFIRRICPLDSVQSYVGLNEANKHDRAMVVPVVASG